MHKKRRISQTNPQDSSAIGASFSTGLRSSENQLIAAKVDEPKTSEYAFFKKLKTNAGHRFNSHHMQRSSPIRNSSKDFRLPIEDGTRVNSRLFLTPNGIASRTLN